MVRFGVGGELIHNAAKMKPASVEVHDNYVTSLDYDSDNNLIYIGKATMGSSKADAVWSIRKLTYDASNNLIDMQYANGDGAFNNIWDSRTSISYS